MYYEAGIAKALGKKIIVAFEKGAEVGFLQACADVSIEYIDLGDLREKLREIENLD